jgi:DNA polymerase III subunit delta'
MLFSDVIGQETLKVELPHLLLGNRLAHAILFLGKEGSGALSLAIAFAQYIVCEKVNSPSRKEASPSLFFDAEPIAETSIPLQACGVCSSCLKAAEFMHPDIHFSYPVVPKKSDTPPLSKDYITEWREFIKNYPYGNVYDWLQFIGAENKQGNITKNECNDIIKKLNLKSFEGGYKILLMWLPEYLGKEGNRLLKLIEEPPEKTVFLLVVENDTLVLPTILSRCQVIKVPQPMDAEIRQALVERNGTPVEAASLIASVSQGNYRDALQMTQHAEEDWQALLREWLNSILKSGPLAQVKWVEEISRLGREKQKQFLRYFNHLLQIAIKIRLIPEFGDGFPEKDKDFAVRLNKITQIEQQQAIVEELDKAAYYIERNANGKIQFLSLTIKIYHIIQDKVVLLSD